MITRTRLKLSSIAALGALTLLSGCGSALIEPPNYSVSQVQSFKVAGAPSQVMMLSVVDANNTLPDAVWTDALSDHAPAPRLQFITNSDDISDGQTLKPENRLVAVVNPTQSTMGDNICTSPQSAKLDGTSNDVIVRFGFCVGDDAISQTRAHFDKDTFQTQLVDSAGTLNRQLFPRHIRDNDHDSCSRRTPGC
ncbi:hypothetical protein [Thalassospira lucentensis]|uniref:hypothetical protein n=1 Tax=Thalassospira lucentensis TaxID=168935 RepID=UPI003AA85729